MWAECMVRLEVDPFFISAVGQDFHAVQLKENFNQVGMVRHKRNCLFYAYLLVALVLCFN